MAIHIRIRCSECGRVLFLSAQKRIAQSSSKGVYQITCVPPCGATSFFRIEDTRAFAVRDDVYRRGHAEPGEYELGQLA
jgi:RNase P subunit RPR2